MNEWMNQWINEIWRLIFQRCFVWDPQFFTNFMWNQALATVSCTFCWPHLPEVLRTRQFYFKRFLCEIELSLKSRTHFADLIFQKCSEPSNFFNMLKCKASPRYSPGHFSLATFADRGLQPQKQRPYFGDHGSHFTKKTQGFAPESVFKPELTPSRPVALLDDDVSDMMIWLTWWWECCPWHGSFLTKLPLVICQMLFVYRCNIYIYSLIIYIIKYIYIYYLTNGPQKLSLEICSIG